MVAKTSSMTAETREAKGSSSARRLRRLGLVPGVIYNSKGVVRTIGMKRHDFERFLRHSRSENVLMDLAVDQNKPLKVLIKEVQHDPITSFVTHVDFIEVSMTAKMRVRIPVVLVGDPVGVTQEGGILEQPVHDIEVECLPGDLIDQIEVDVTGLKLGQSIKTGDLKLGDKITMLTHADVSVALVSVPRKEEEEAKPEEGAEAGAEPEVIGKKEDGEEGAEGEESADKAEKGGAKAAGGAAKAAGAEKGGAGAKAAGADKGAAKADKKEKK